MSGSLYSGDVWWKCVPTCTTNPKQFSLNTLKFSLLMGFGFGFFVCLVFCEGFFNSYALKPSNRLDTLYLERGHFLSKCSCLYEARCIKIKGPSISRHRSHDLQSKNHQGRQTTTCMYVLILAAHGELNTSVDCPDFLFREGTSCSILNSPSKGLCGKGILF